MRNTRKAGQTGTAGMAEVGESRVEKECVGVQRLREGYELPDIEPAEEGHGGSDGGGVTDMSTTDEH